MDLTEAKAALRKELRAERKAHVASLPREVLALIFSRPPAPVLDLVPAGSTIGLYHATADEAPTSAYARFFYEAGHSIALPRTSSGEGEMHFRAYTDPFAESDLEAGPFGLIQPSAKAALVQPDVVFVPLLGFTDAGQRLGQGGGFYDRWLAAHPGVTAIGLAWDVQLRETLPTEPHDHALAAIVTPSRLYGPF